MHHEDHRDHYSDEFADSSVDVHESEYIVETGAEFQKSEQSDHTHQSIEPGNFG